MSLMFKLDQDRKGSGLRCDRDGLHLDRRPLLQKNQEGKFEAKSSVELRKIFGSLYGEDSDWDSRIRSVNLIANALNKGDLARATMTAVLMRLPDPAGPGRITDVDGLLEKANFDPDEPRDEQGRWTIDGSAASGTSRRDLRTQLADAGMSDASNDSVAEAVAHAAEDAARERAGTGAEASAVAEIDRTGDHGDGPPTTQTNADGMSMPVGDASEPPSFVNEKHTDTDDLGIYAEYGTHVGGVQLAGATIPMGSIGITRANPANWANLTRLPNGALELGSGQIIAAATLLSAIDRSRERNAVQSAIAKFQLNPTQAADVLAARAYVWAKTAAPWNFKGVPVSGSGLETAAKSIALLELARPGTLYLALQGDKLSWDYLESAAHDVLNDAAVLENRIRLVNAPLALQSSSTVARDALKLKRGDNMQAHHLVPVNIVGRNLPLATLASKAGWRTDSPSNLIALPGDPQTQAERAAEGEILPIQSSAHPLYDAQTQEQIDALKLLAGSPLTPKKARFILDKVAKENLRQITFGRWQPILKSSQA